MTDKKLINIQSSLFNNESVQTVNARELHEFLESGVRFNDWIRKRISEYSFRENVDFIRFELPAGVKMAGNGGGISGITNTQKNVALQSIGYKSNGQQGRIEYAISLDMAKELSMVERNKKGKEARQYFIACEKKAKQLSIPQSLPEALRLAADLAEQNKVLLPKANALDRLVDADGAMNLTNSAKHLQMRPCDLTKALSLNKWIYRRVGGKSWVAYQDKLQQGLLIHKVATVYREDG